MWATSVTGICAREGQGAPSRSAKAMRQGTSRRFILRFLLIESIEGRGLLRQAAGAKPGDGPVVAVALDVLIHLGVGLLEAPPRKGPEEGEVDRGQGETVEP